MLSHLGPSINEWINFLVLSKGWGILKVPAPFERDPVIVTFPVYLFTDICDGFTRRVLLESGIPILLVIILLSVPELDTAVNTLSCLLQQMEAQLLLFVGLVLQEDPLNDTITLLPDPLLATATNRLISGDQMTLDQLLSTGEDPMAQVIPLGLVIILLPVPLLLTATSNWYSGDQQTDVQLLSAGVVLEVQVIPSGLVIG
jgi:hypothetical protein